MSYDRAVEDFKKAIPEAQVEFMRCDMSDFGCDHWRVAGRLWPCNCPACHVLA